MDVKSQSIKKNNYLILRISWTPSSEDQRIVIDTFSAQRFPLKTIRCLKFQSHASIGRVNSKG